jgi:hypothetical protein
VEDAEDDLGEHDESTELPLYADPDWPHRLTRLLLLEAGTRYYNPIVQL